MALSVLRWSSCCWFFAPVFVLCFSVHCFMSFQVLQLSWWGGEWWLFYFCLSSWCLVIVIVLWLFLAVPLYGLQCVIVVFPAHTLSLCFVQRRMIKRRLKYTKQCKICCRCASVLIYIFHNLPKVSKSALNHSAWNNSRSNIDWLWKYLPCIFFINFKLCIQFV